MTPKPAKGSSIQLGWFAVGLVFESINPDTEEGLALEQRIVVLKAADEVAARERAGQLGRDGQMEYESADGNPVRWLFRGIGDVKTLIDDEIVDGTEVYYSYFPIGPTPGFQAAGGRPVGSVAR